MPDVNPLFIRINNDNGPFGKIIKIYIFKLMYYKLLDEKVPQESIEYKLKNLLNESWEELPKKLKRHEIDFGEIWEDDEENEKNLNLNSFLSIDSPEEENEFLNECRKFEIIRNKKISDYFDENYIQNNKLDLFLSISMNKIISNLGSKNNLYIDEYNDFSQYSDILFKNLRKNIKDLIFLFYKEKKYNDILKPKIEQLKKSIKIGGEPFESLLYGFRFCVQSLLNNDIDNESQQYLYSSILSQNCLNTIQNYFIPGIYDARYHIKTISEIENYFKNKRKYWMLCMQLWLLLFYRYK